MAKTATLFEDFSSDDGTFVDAIAGGTIAGGVCSMPYTSGSTVKQTDVNWDLTESQVDVEIVALGEVESDEAYFCFGAAGGLFDPNQFQIIVGQTGTPDEYYLVPREIDGDGNNVPTEPFIDVAAADVRWLRFRHTGTTAFWETSPDRDTWTIRRQKTPTFTPSAHRVKLAGFNFTGNGVASADYDNVNGGSAPAPPIDGSGTLVAAPAQLTGAGSALVAGSGQVEAPVPELAGAGDAEVTGSGSVDAAPAALAGAGQTLITADGAVTGPPAAISGQGNATVTASGSATPPPATISGFGTIGAVPVTGAGAVTAPPAAVNGTGSVLVDGNGAIVTPSAIINGTGSIVVDFEGDLVELPTLTTALPDLAVTTAIPALAIATTVPDLSTVTDLPALDVTTALE